MRPRYWIALLATLLLALWSLHWNTRLESLHPDVGAPALHEREPALAAPRPAAARRDAAAPEPAPQAVSSAPVPPEPAARTGDATLEITFAREGEPLAGVDCWLALGPRPRDHEIHDERRPFPPDAPFRESRVDGVTEFRDLPAGAHELGFDTTNTGRRPLRFVTDLLHTSHAYRVNLGSARVIGSVFGADGRPLPDVAVAVVQREPDPLSKLKLVSIAITDRFGEFEVLDLPAGPHDVVFEIDARFDGLGEGERRTVELVRGQTKVVRLGPSGLARRFEGRLLSAQGEPFEGRGRLVIAQAGDAGAFHVPVGERGSFEVALDPGTFDVRAFVDCGPAEGFELRQVVITDVDLRQDLIVPGARLRGRLVGLAPGTLVGSDALPIVDVHPAEAEYPAAFRSVTVHADGTFTFDGLAEGAWVVGAWPLRTSADAEVLVHMPATGVVNLDLQVTAGSSRR